jgi:uncharacterized membrane protein YiaA
MAKTEIIVLADDRLWKSVARDTWTAIVLGGLTMLGWWAGSTALQWIGGFFAVLFIMGRVTAMTVKSRYTIAEARAKLDEYEKEAV